MYDDQAERWINHAGSNPSFYKFLERPAIKSLLPTSLDGKSVLLLGVGSGEEIDMYQRLGAGRIVGIDSSSKLLTAARHRHNGVEFRLADLNKLELEGSYDVVASSMALHYVADWTGLFQRLSRHIKPGGHLIFSTHNPVWWAGEKIKTPEGYAWVIGVAQNTKDRSRRALGRYLGPDVKHEAEIIKGLHVEYYHRSWSKMLNEIVKSPLALETVLEPLPDEAAKTADPSFYRVTSRLSPIAVFKLTKL